MILFRKLWITQLLFLFSCISSTPHGIAGRDIILKFSKEAQYYGLNLLDSTGSFNSSFPPVNIYFYSYQKADVNEARRLLVESVDYFLQFVNSEPELKSYIHHYPIDCNDFNFFIMFYEVNPYDKLVTPPFLAGVLVSREIVNYVTINPITGKLKNFHDETYQRARGIVEHQNSLLNLQSLTN